MIRPTKQLIWIFCTLWVLCFLALLAEDSGEYISFALICVLAIGVLDALMVLRIKGLEVRRTVSNSLPVGICHHVVLRVNNRSGKKLNLSVFDDYPTQHSMEGLPASLKMDDKQVAEVTYGFTPASRGLYKFGQTGIMIESPLKLWSKRIKVGEESGVKVYPNYSEVIKYGILATDQRLNQMGVLKKRQRGEGTDFHQLREFREGDRLSSIDWKATSRLNKIISREYQQERDQQILIMLDCSKNMRARDGELSHFDHALNALLLISYVATKQGDSVGLMTFGGHDRWIPPSKSPSTVSGLLDKLYDLEATEHSADYMRAAEKCRALMKKRAFVIIISNLREEDDTELLPAIRLLQRQNLVLFAGLREKALDDSLEAPVDDFNSALNYSAVNDYLRHRKEAFEQLRGNNVLHMDTLPEKLPISLVNRYLDVKSSGRL